MTRFYAGLVVGTFVGLSLVVFLFLYGNPTLDSELDDPSQALFIQGLFQWLLFLIPEVILLVLIWRVWKTLLGIQLEMGKIRRGLSGRELGEK